MEAGRYVEFTVGTKFTFECLEMESELGATNSVKLNRYTVDQRSTQ